MNRDRTVRCPVCRTEFDERAVYDEPCCPSCKSDLMPEYPDLDVTVMLNWDNLRLLANWALEWAKTHVPDPTDLARRDFEVILTRLRAVRPSEGEPLTLDDTLAELERQGIKLTDPDLKPPKKIVLQRKPKKKSLVN